MSGIKKAFNCLYNKYNFKKHINFYFLFYILFLLYIFFVVVCMARLGLVLRNVLLNVQGLN